MISVRSLSSATVFGIASPSVLDFVVNFRCVKSFEWSYVLR